MYYYLGLILDKDIKIGNFSPSFVLCKQNKQSETRAPWRMVRPDGAQGKMPKLLVTSFNGHEDMIDFMSAYRTRDKMYKKGRGKRSKAMMKYYPKGALFWFPCDIYGIQKDAALFIKRVPDKKHTGNTNFFKQDQGFTRLKQAWAYRPSIKEILSHEPAHLDMPYSNIKPKLRQGR